MDYTVHKNAKSKHERMGQSVPPTHDFDVPFLSEPSRWSRLTAGLHAIAGHVLTSPPKPPRRSRPVLIVSNPSPFLCARVREDSNHELDWLWAADHVSAVEEIHYCLEHALYINPNNFETQRTLSKLVVPRTADETFKANPQGFAQVSDPESTERTSCTT